MTISVTGFFSPALAIVRYLWGRLQAPRLRLDLPHRRGEPSNRGLQIVPNGAGWQVVFGLTLLNEGRSPARNWRVRFVLRDALAMMYLDQGRDGRTFRDTYVGPGRQCEVLAAGPSDTVPPNLPVPINGAHTLNFGHRPDVILVDCWLTADGMSTGKDTLRLELQWTTLTARFRWQ